MDELLAVLGLVVGVVLAVALVAGGVMLTMALDAGRQQITTAGTTGRALPPQDCLQQTFYLQVDEQASSWLVKGRSWMMWFPYPSVTSSTGREFPCLSFDMAPGHTTDEGLARWRGADVVYCETERFVLDAGLWAVTVNFREGTLRSGEFRSLVCQGSNCLVVVRATGSSGAGTLHLYLSEKSGPYYLAITCSEGRSWQATVEPVFPWMFDHRESLEEAVAL